MLDVLFNPLSLCWNARDLPWFLWGVIFLCWNPHGFADGRPETTRPRDPKPDAFVGIPWRVEGSWLSTCLNQSWIQQMILMPVMGYSPSELDANQPDLICDMMEYTYRYQYVPQTDIYRSIHQFIHPFIHSSIHLSIYPSTPKNRYWEYTRSIWGSDLIYLRNKRLVPCHF